MDGKMDEVYCRETWFLQKCVGILHGLQKATCTESKLFHYEQHKEKYGRSPRRGFQESLLQIEEAAREHISIMTNLPEVPEATPDKMMKTEECSEVLTEDNLLSIQGSRSGMSVIRPNFVVKEESIVSEETWQENIKDVLTDSDEMDYHDINMKVSAALLTGYSEAENSMTDTFKAISTAGLNRHAVQDNSEENTKANEGLSMRCLNHRGKSHEENFKKSTASSSSCVGREVRGECRKQDGNQLEVGRGISRSSGESCIRTQANEESSKKEMQGLSSKGSCSKQSKKQKETRKPFCCNICGKGFQRTRNLENHERIHSGDKPFQCTSCNKSFTTKANLVWHKGVHSEERPYKCPLCEKAFKRSSHLKSHIRIHIRQKPFACNVCGKAFIQRSALNKHMCIHTGEKPHRCKECGIGYSNSSNLIQHMRIHTGNKPYKCNECGKTFSLSHHLTDHKRVHTGERPFTCSQCESCFTRSSHLKRHRTYVHGAASPVSLGTR